MKENIDIAELLRKCGVGTTLYCPMFGNCRLIAVSTDKDNVYPIKIISPKDDIDICFSIDGVCFLVEKRDVWFYNSGDECLLFPSKDYRSWEGVKVVNKQLVIPEVTPKNEFNEFCHFGDSEISITIHGEKHILVKGYEDCSDCSLRELCDCGVDHLCGLFPRGEYCDCDNYHFEMINYGNNE